MGGRSSRGTGARLRVAGLVAVVLAVSGGALGVNAAGEVDPVASVNAFADDAPAAWTITVRGVSVTPPVLASTTAVLPAAFPTDKRSALAVPPSVTSSASVPAPDPV